ncbi:MAG: proteasome accessory factor PafA2 family protein [Thermodesulfobacteriota bacterium]
MRRGRGIEHEYILNTDPPLSLDANVERRKLIANAIEGLKKRGRLFPNAVWGLKGEDGNFDYETSLRRLWPLETRPPCIGKNGMRIYDDALHLEISTPVYTTPFDAVIYAKVSEYFTWIASQEASQSIGRQVYGYTSNISLRKNKKLYEAVACGTHGNITILRRTFNSSETKDAQRALIPYLVTRILVTGSGGYVPFAVDEKGQRFTRFSGQDPAEAHGSTLVGEDICFVISPRSHFVNCKVSEDTTVKRGLFNLRDEPHANRDLYWRFHDINWEGTRSDLQIYMRDLLHTFVIAAFEKGYLKDAPVLQNPLKDLKHISMDLKFDWRVKRTDGQTVDAVNDILIGYYMKKIETMLDREKAPSEDWRELERLSRFIRVIGERDLNPLVYGLDWVTKLFLIEGCNNSREGLAACNQFCLTDESLLKYLGEKVDSLGDTLFEPDESISLMAKWVPDITPEGIKKAVREGILSPPPFTRERKRIEVLAERSEENFEASWAFVVDEEGTERQFLDPLEVSI